MSNPQAKLLEVDFPLRKISEESVREKSIRHGHISTLHPWWARRPLAASRATALAALLPDDPNSREDLKQLIADISPWEAVAKADDQPDPTIDEARELIRKAYGGHAPRVLDCFAGGGAIPLEAFRLGCETYALDYNPVAVIINKAVLEFPRKYGKSVIQKDAASGPLGLDTERKVNPLLEAVRYWGNWVVEEARKELEQYYPKDADGFVPVGYIWARTLPCQNPTCGAEIPLMRQMWLAKREDRKIAIKLVPNKAARSVATKIVQDNRVDFDPETGTVSSAHVRCPVCGGTFDDSTTRRLFREGKASQRIMAVVSSHPHRPGKNYRLPTDLDAAAYNAAESALEVKRQALWREWEIDPIPNEELTPERPSPNARGLSAVVAYQMKRWSDLFNSRQMLALVTLADKVRLSQRQMAAHYDVDFTKAVTTYLALVMDRTSIYCSSLGYWHVSGEKASPAMQRQAMGMVFDYFESIPLASSFGWASNLDWVSLVLSHCSQISGLGSTTVEQGSATELPYRDNYFDAVLTDPPYYDNVPYSDLSDFFYVWLKRTLGDLYADLFATPLVPKTQEVIWHQRHGGNYVAGREFFERRITDAFIEIRRVLKPQGIAVIVFAHKTTEAWEAIIKALLEAGLYMTASWPIHTEMQARLVARETAALSSSIYMVCRKRTETEIGEFIKVRREIEKRVKNKLDQFWNEGIRGADFFMSAIGPGVEVFGTYARVEKLTGDPVGVPELLDYIRKVVNDYAIERILHSGYTTRGIDPSARFYLLFRWAYNHSRVQFDEARKLALSTGLELSDYWNEGGFVKREGEYIRVLNPVERTWNSRPPRQRKIVSPQLELPLEEDGAIEPIRQECMVDVLHKAVQLWTKNTPKALSAYLERTYGSTEAFWRIAQAVADVLPEGDKEKQLLQGLLYRENGYASSQMHQVRTEAKSQQRKNGRKRGTR